MVIKSILDVSNINTVQPICLEVYVYRKILCG